MFLQLTNIKKPCYVGHKICVVLTFSVYVQFPRVRDTSFTGVTVEECRVLLSGMETHFICVPWRRHTLFLLTFSHSTLGSVQQMDEEKKGLWKTIMERFSKSSDDAPEKTTEK